MSVFYLITVIFSYMERLAFLRQAAALVLAAECLTLGTLGGVRRALVFARTGALGGIRSAAFCIWCLTALPGLGLGIAAIFGAGDWRLACAVGAGAAFSLARLLLDLRGFMGRFGKLTRAAMSELALCGRGYGLALIAGALPLGAWAFFSGRLFAWAYASIAFLLYAARGGRLSDHESEKRVAGTALALALPLMFCPSIALLFDLPRYIFLMPGWAVFVSLNCTLSRGRFRYGLVLSALMFLCALTPLLPPVPASMLSVVFACALLYFMRPCLYALKLNLRARRFSRSA